MIVDQANAQGTIDYGRVVVRLLSANLTQEPAILQRAFDTGVLAPEAKRSNVPGPRWDEWISFLISCLADQASFAKAVHQQEPQLSLPMRHEPSPALPSRNGAGITKPQPQLQES